MSKRPTPTGEYAVGDNVCKLHLELFDSYLKKSKEKPELESCPGVTIKEYEPDM